ncbi:hypothetical protein ACQPYH_29550 [Kribbella sp. CA-245084]|uniref:hypothetical protein n=1 Tax=Kribbella sp. CA-245084 TaxID=3239940 RepID=UPI003D8FAEBE
MIDLTRVCTTCGRDPHYVNVDLNPDEIGYLLLNGSGEIIKPVPHDQYNEEHNEFMRAASTPRHQTVVGALPRVRALSCGARRGTQTVHQRKTKGHQP